MKNEFVVDGALAMTRGSVLSIEDGRGFVLHVREGSIWLTQEGDRQDRYLGAGASFRLDRDGLAVAQATSLSTVTVIPPQSQAGARRESLTARLHRAWTGLFSPHARPTSAAL